MTPNVPLQTSALFGHVPHGFTGRQGGESSGPGATLDLKLGALAERPLVRANRQAVLHALKLAARAFVSVKQVHGDAVVEVTAQASPHIEADGIWTRDKQCVLAILVADCTPILLTDKQGTLVAAVHAGWRGTQSRIAARMVERLHAATGVKPEALVAAMGPCIGPCCFEIGHDTAALLRAAYPQASGAITQRKSHKWAADLWALNRVALQEAGLAPEHIDTVPICTMCTQDHYSYRRDAGVTGRQAGIIALA